MGWLDYKAGDLPVTERVAGEILSLPMYAELTGEELAYIADSIKAFYTGPLSVSGAVSAGERV
jgi:dTDP-4-amino-4,6-dideoxygalactose transaminase